MKLFRNSLIDKCVVKHISQTLTATEERGHIIIYAGVRTRASQARRIGRRRFPKNRGGVETGALLYPLPGFYLTVRVKVGAQVAMTAKTAAGVVAKQQHHEHAERMLLERGAGVTGAAPFVNAAFVADADTVGVMPTGVRAGELYRAQGLYIAVLADIKMVACAGEAPAQVVCCQVIFRIAAVAARGGTVDNKEVDESHGIRQA